MLTDQLPGITSPAELTAAEELRLLEEIGYIDDDEKFGKGNVTTTTEKVVPSKTKSSLVISEIGDYYEDDPGKSTPNISHPTEANLTTTPVSTKNNFTESRNRRILKLKRNWDTMMKMKEKMLLLKPYLVCPSQPR